MKNVIQIQYKTSDGLLWDDHEEALANAVLLHNTRLYPEDHSRKVIVEVIAKDLNIPPKASYES